jgi:hypothetical protein
MAVIDPTMARELGFDATDVATNQQGVLTDDQQVVLTNAARVGRRRRGVMLVLFFVLIVAAVLAALTGAQSPVTPAMTAVVVALALVAVGIVITMSRRAGRDIAAYEHPMVRSVEGRPLCEPTTSDTVDLWVGDVRFRVFGDLARLFDPTRTYRVYYVEGPASAPAILSVEITG